MTITDLLAASGLERSDGEVLLAAAFGVDRSWIHAHAGDEADAVAAETFMGFALRRINGEPVAYILGVKEFYGRMFRVGPGVLVPRPCTEELVGDALTFIDGEREASVREIDAGISLVTRPLRDLGAVRTVVDVGTGSGCIAITIACERPDARCIAIDVSDEALETARANAERHSVADRVTFVLGSGLDPVADLQEPFFIVSNPPYVADESLLAADVRAHEPMLALMGGGSDGADILKMIAREATAHDYCAGIAVECLTAQTSIF
jgi:release factor glutamine methyltransferase